MRYTFVFFMVFSCSLFAQQQFPRLITTVDEKIENIQLSEMDVEVKILGEIAETRTTMTFYNPHSRVLEGNLHFPLPEGVTISGYALDVDGVMVDGVVVEKHEGRRVFEREERKGIDPGLVEWVKGNNFQTRVYPIPAKGSRTVMVRYLSELPRVSGQTSYHLPLNLAKAIKQFHLRVEVIRATSPPVVKKGALANFSFNAWRSSYVAETTLRDVVLDEDMMIGLPDVEKMPVRVEKNADGQYYFAINDHEAASFKPKVGENRIPSHITLYWDASGSRGNVDHKREFALLETLFMQWKSKPVAVDLILFRNKAEDAGRFNIANDDAEELLDVLRKTDYDGGTQMAAISPNPNSITPDFFLVFTDGLSNFGDEKPTGFKAPVYIISNEPTSNHPFLSWLALETQGQYFNLAQLDDKTVVANIGLPVYSFMSARYNPAHIRETFPRTMEPVHGRFILAGKLTGPKAEITLEFGAQGRVLRKVKYVIPQKDADEGNMIGTLWAQKKIKQLSVFPERNIEELTVIGKQYGLVTPGTSLLVLETLEQYVEYNVKPPDTLPEMQEKYLERMAEREEEAKDYEENKLENILNLWSKRLEWWETHFPKKNIDIREEAIPASKPAANENPENQAVTGQQEERIDAIQPAEEDEALEVAIVPDAPETTQPASSLGTSDSPRAVLSGTVTDVSGAIIPGVSITATEVNTGLVTSSNTINSGVYTFPDLLPGTYDVSAELPSFQSRTFTDVVLRAGEKFLLNFELEVAGITTMVSVASSASGILLESSSSVGEVIKDSTSGIPIAIRGWNPDTPYIEKLRKAAPKLYLEVYLKERKTYGNSPAFFLDCADFFFKHERPVLGLRVLSNIAELQLENPEFLRILAYRLAGLGQTKLSVQLFEKVLKMRPEEPQSYRDLALVLEEQKKFVRAMELLNHVVMTQWDRFDEIEVIALMELNRIIPLAREQGITKIPIDPRLVRLLDVDIRIVLSWDADMTDIDLWVTEPSGEKVSYEHTLTTAGGRISQDFTAGYGPEEYAIRKARLGKYLIQANFYGSNSQRLQGPVTVQADVYTNYGRKNEKRQRLTLRLGKAEDTYTVGEIVFK